MVAWVREKLGFEMEENNNNINKKGHGPDIWL